MAKLYFYYASMNAGKSTNLLQANFNYGERGMRTTLARMKPQPLLAAADFEREKVEVQFAR